MKYVHIKKETHKVSTKADRAEWGKMKEKETILDIICAFQFLLLVVYITTVPKISKKIYICNSQAFRHRPAILATLKVEAARLQVQGLPILYSKFKASLRSCYTHTQRCGCCH